MSLTLGEKLRQARESRGISIRDVAEQTHISALYLESIENDDYRILPGGIFNKGFVKSFARHVGVDEQEALQDYAKLFASQNSQSSEELKTYRPEVLTDDRSGSSIFPTLIFAGVILALMTAGILALVNYIQQNPMPETANKNSNANVISTSNANAPNANAQTPVAVSTENWKVEFKALNSPVSLSSTADGKTLNELVKVDTSSVFEPKESLRLKYSKALAKNVEIKINDKVITLPTENPGRNVIEFEINKGNIKQILESGQIAVIAPTKSK